MCDEIQMGMLRIADSSYVRLCGGSVEGTGAGEKAPWVVPNFWAASLCESQILEYNSECAIPNVIRAVSWMLIPNES